MKWKLPQWPFKPFKPFSNPVGLTKLQKKLFGRQRPKFTWRLAGKIALYTFGTLVLIIVFLFAWFAKDLPTPGKIRTLAAASSTRLFDRNMQPLYTISGEKKRIIIDQKDIPDSIKHAVISLEDHNFYDHFGLDFKGAARAVLFGGSRGGGSTITQQFARNGVLGDTRRNVFRKIKEAILSVEIEALYSKDEILAMYLNEIPFGGNNYGVEAAAQSFFGKPAKDLTVTEAATLAALIQRPSTLSPYGPNTKLLVERRNFALDSMAQLGYISADEATAGKDTELKVVAKRESITAPHFVLYVKDWLVDYLAKDLGDKQLAEQKVEEGGMTVITTLDLPKQRIAEDAVTAAKDTNLKRAGASNAGLVSIDPKRGEVLAMVGSVDYFNEQFGAFNIATAERQPGSSFKPIVYATGFKEKLNPAATIFDLKTDFGNYVPTNFDNQFRGPVTIRQALGNSLNIPAVKVAGIVGVDKVLETAKDMGVTTLTDRDRYGLSIALGGGEVRLLDMATAYGVFANKGTLVPTTPILKITDNKGKEIYNHDEPKDSRQVLDPQVAYEISSILSDEGAKRPVFSGVMNVLTLKGRPVASKTGTTNSYRDAWTIGYTPQFATAVWAGNNDQAEMNRAGGSVAAAPIWDAYMEKVHEGLPVEQFERPAEIQEVTVDRLSNKLPVDGSDPVKDIFASWQVPKDKDDVHVRVRVCRENGLLADETIPDELTEDRTYTNIHSEKPDNPNWEGPVQAWAASNNLTNKPPTEKCSVDNSTKPSIKITAPSDGATVSGVINISTEASAPSGIKSVDFYIDNTSFATATVAPYTAGYNSASLSNGTHTIRVTATSNAGASASDQISVTVNTDNQAPDNVASYNGTGGPGPGRVTLTWVNPSASDLRFIRIFVYRDSTGAHVSTTEVAATPGANGVVAISGLQSGVAYQFVAKSVDAIGNESSGVTRILTAP